MEWQKIDSAPKQKPVLICRRRWIIKDPTKPDVTEETEIIANARFDRTAAGRDGDWVVASSFGGEGNTLTLLSHGWVVTHWMPMPDAP